jgi:hypothetical protein
LSGTTTMAQAFTAAAGSVLVIWEADTADAASSPIADAGLLIDTATYMGLTFTSAGLSGWLLDTTRKSITQAASTGVRNVGMFRWGTGSGGQLEMKVNGNTATPVACGDMDVTTGTIEIGISYDQSAAYDGKIRTMAAFASTISDALYTKFRKWAQVARGAV